MITEINPIEHFKGLIKSAFEHQRLETDEMAEYYLSSLLASYVTSENMSREPLAITYLKAMESDRATQAHLMKQVGDFSLFMSGFFSDSLKRKIVDIDYYIAIGSSSYGSLAALHRGDACKKTLFRLFTELALRFNAFAEIISEVSETSGLTNPNDILRLYEKWLKTRSKRTENMLKNLGIEPVNTTTRPIH